ncbi:hypothetical protein HMPREF0381_1030 [Lachnoanaerobaculum saburreum DSM 3986]|uniref:Uncharacterized protein n=1 Tax=Lachnoanaerobaculum saburreum DSM 3986 TaxID=887325 RepID=E6LM45_9FIRM|nr:hypothetical protein HMPREF0381_1030 [Lachnoanaerobaculum saburreum DSM 3986]
MYMQQQTETLLVPKERLQESVENLLKQKHQGNVDNFAWSMFEIMLPQSHRL